MSIRESGFYRGVQENQIAKRQKTFRDIRTVGEKLFDFVNSNEFIGFIQFMLILTAIMFPVLLLPNLLMSVGFYLIRMSSIKKQMLVGRLSKETGLKDLSDPIPDTDDKKHFKAGGIFLVGKDRQTKQEFWLADKDVLTHILLFGTTGAGKALPLTEDVLTPGGFMKMADIKVGDEVVAIDGSPTKVLGVYPQGVEDVYEVEFNDGRIVEASGGHLWEVHHKHWCGRYKEGQSIAGKAEPRVLTTLEIQEKLSSNKGTFNIPLSEPVQYPKAKLGIHPYLLGALLGDGNFIGKNFRFSNEDKDVVDKVNNLLMKDGAFLKQYEGNSDTDYNICLIETKNGRKKDGSYHKNPIREQLEKLKLWDCHSHEKFIPVEYLPENLSIEQRIELINGLMDTDGTATSSKKGGLSFTSTSEKLANGVRKIVWSLGGIANISQRVPTYKDKNGNKKQGRIAYTVYIRVKNPKSMFYSNRKREAVPSSNQYSATLKLRIKSIKLIGQKETQCIKVAHERSLFLTRNYVATHNTEALVSLVYNAIALGSGLFYTDPKAAPKLAFQIFAMSRFLGREHDFLVVNYGVSSRSPYKLNSKRITNTMNPFSMGSAEMLSEVLNALLPLSDGDNAVFSNAAQTMVKSLMYGLVEKRNKKEISLSVKTIRDYMALDKYIELATDEGLSDDAKSAMQSYLSSVGWREGMPQQKLADVSRQHGFSLSYFSLPLASLADTYGNIYLNAKGEVDSYDVIKYRRIAVILLPALEMSPGQLKNVGQITLSSVRNACAIGLGDRLEGHKTDVIDALPTNSPVPDVNIPFLAVTDEYAAIPTPGFAEVLTQGRGLGVAAIIASQDYAGIKGADEKGAKQIVANTKVKMIAAMDDPEDTWDLVEKLAGKVEVATASGFDAKNSVVGNYIDGAGASFEQRSRVDIMDLQSQIEGEFHGFFKGKLIRGQTFYANPDIDDTILSINEKIGIDDIDRMRIEREYGEIKELTEAIVAMIGFGGITKEKANSLLELNDQQKRLIKGLKQGFEAKESRAFGSKTITALLLAKRYLHSSSNAIQKLVSIKKQKLEENGENIEEIRGSESESISNLKNLNGQESKNQEVDEDLPFGGMLLDDDEDTKDDHIEFEDQDAIEEIRTKKDFNKSVVKGLNMSTDPVQKQAIKSDARYIEKSINPGGFNANKVNSEIEDSLISIKYEEPFPKDTKKTEAICEDVNKIIELVESKSKKEE